MQAGQLTDADIETKIAEMKAARTARDFKKSDAIRAELRMPASSSKSPKTASAGGESKPYCRWGETVSTNDRPQTTNDRAVLS